MDQIFELKFQGIEVGLGTFVGDKHASFSGILEVRVLTSILGLICRKADI